MQDRRTGIRDWRQGELETPLGGTRLIQHIPGSLPSHGIVASSSLSAVIHEKYGYGSFVIITDSGSSQSHHSWTNARRIGWRLESEV